ncbi:MAG: creatininase family protein [Thermoleophilia bacterium]|nr:creatininase family protein [Thermoleophilia bacterium]
MGHGPILFDEQTRVRLRELSSEALCVWPVGATEQHGPHLPTATDAMHAEWVAREAAVRAAGLGVTVVVAPTLHIGSSAHHLPFGGTMSLPTETYYRVIRAGVESLVTDGFRRVMVVNGHGGNHELIQLAVRDLALALSDVHLGAGSWWTIAWDALVAAGAAEIGRFPGHAGRFETSLVLALRPDLVVHPLPHRDEPGTTDPRRFGADVRAEHAGFWQSIDGYGDSPDLASAELGRRWLDVSADVVAAAYAAFQHASGGPVG